MPIFGVRPLITIEDLDLMTCRDRMDEVEGFYRNVLGLKVIGNFRGGRPRFDFGQYVLEIIPIKQGEEISPLEVVCRVGRTTYDLLLAKLQKANVPMETVDGFIQFRDPDGRTIKLSKV